MTVALLAGETLLLVLLSVLVVGLLRSHAEILRRLGPEDDGPNRAGGGAPGPSVAPDRGDAPAATDVSGLTLDGDAVQFGLGPGGTPTLLAFLSSGCTICEGLWHAFDAHGGSLPGGVRPVIVVKDPSHERPARLRELAPADVPLVMSSAAWEAYSVPTTPYFIYIDGGSGRVYGEGSAGSWDQIASLLADALDDLATLEGRARRRPAGPAGSAAQRAVRAERALEDAGIGPGHRSLYPSGGNGGSRE